MNSERFFHSLKNLYGEDIYTKIQKYEKVKIQKTSRLCDLAFLKRCRDSKIIPKFLHLRNFLNTYQSKKILERASFLLLRERIQFIRKEIDRLDKECIYLHLILSSVLDFNNWNSLDEILFFRVETHRQKLSTNQKLKFDNLLRKQKFKFNKKLPINKLVINLSSHSLSDTACSVLSKGLEFGITPNKIPTEDIVTSVEAAIQSLPVEKAQEIRHETVRILKKVPSMKQNLSKKEFEALRELKKNNNIVILPADKGKATVVMNKTDYIDKVDAHLDDPAYIKLKCNPLGSSKFQTTKLLKQSSLPQETIKRLIPQDPVMSRFYGLPKIHKKDVPLRPIVNSIGSTTYELSKYLDTLLKPLIGQKSSYVKDSRHFIELIGKMNLTDKDLLVSFDVSSLFTKVPIKDTLTLLEDHYSDDIIKLFKHCLTSCFFIFNGTYYKQVDGVAMGSPISPSIANFYMEKFEETALETANKKPTIWLRYVDDIFAVWPHGIDELNIFLNHLNSQHDNIKFTIEIEENNKLSFLDVLLEKQDGRLLHSVYRKPTHTNRYLHETSNHHPAQKTCTIKSLYRRASNLCHPVKLQEEINFLDEVFMKNGYKKSQIKRALRTNNRREKEIVQERKRFVTLPFIANVTDKIGRFLKKFDIVTSYKSSFKICQFLGNVKDKIPLQSSGIYRTPCQCGKVYIGQTGRTVATRLKEHQRSIRLNYPEKSAIAQHAIQELHGIDFNNTKIIAREDHLIRRLIREAIEIKKNPNNFNLSAGFELNNSWSTLF